MKLCSACLLGINCKYNGKNNANRKVIAMAKKEILIPVCPEQLGRAFNAQGADGIKEWKGSYCFRKDVTKQLRKGAFETLKMAKMYNVKEAILKARSPSCGFGQLKLMTGKVVKGNGFTADLLNKKGIKIVSEEDL